MTQKNYPANPNLVKIVDDSKISYVLRDPDHGTEIQIFNYQVVGKKPEEYQFLGQGQWGWVNRRRNPTAQNIAVKKIIRGEDELSDQVVTKIEEMNVCYRFLNTTGLLRYFNIPLYTSPDKQLQRAINGFSLRDYMIEGSWRFNRNHIITMFKDLKLAFQVFSEKYVHGDIGLHNIMYDPNEICFTLIDFDYCTPINRVNINPDLNKLNLAEAMFLDAVDYIQQDGTFIKDMNDELVKQPLKDFAQNSKTLKSKKAIVNIQPLRTYFAIHLVPERLRVVLSEIQKKDDWEIFHITPQTKAHKLPAHAENAFRILERFLSTAPELIEQNFMGWEQTHVAVYQEFSARTGFFSKRSQNTERFYTRMLALLGSPICSLFRH